MAAAQVRCSAPNARGRERGTSGNGSSGTGPVHGGPCTRARASCAERGGRGHGVRKHGGRRHRGRPERDEVRGRRGCRRAGEFETGVGTRTAWAECCDAPPRVRWGSLGVALRFDPCGKRVAGDPIAGASAVPSAVGSSRSRITRSRIVRSQLTERFGDGPIVDRPAGDATVRTRTDRRGPHSMGGSPTNVKASRTPSWEGPRYEPRHPPAAPPRGRSRADRTLAGPVGRRRLAGSDAALERLSRSWRFRRRLRSRP